MAADAQLRPRRRRGSLRKPVLYTLSILYSLYVLLPVAYMVFVAFQPTATAGTMIVPKVWHLQTFAQMWTTIDLARYMVNSLVISIATGICASILALGAGYVIARFRFRFRNSFRISLLATNTILGILLLLPLYVGFVVIHNTIGLLLVGTYYGVVITYMTFALPFAIWMLSVYIVNLPVDLEEQAMVDGAGQLAVLRWITFPLAVPGMVVTFIFSFLLAWNDVLYAEVLTNPQTRTLGVALQYYASENSFLPQWNQLMGASVVSAIPAIVLFMIVQRWIVTGLSSGSIKG
ncbi:MAG: carbohydrate ABC transporter permease [Candidatus Dormibacteraceae bacterium]